MITKKILIEVKIQNEEDFTDLFEELSEELVEASLTYDLVAYLIEEIPPNSEIIKKI